MRLIGPNLWGDWVYVVVEYGQDRGATLLINRAFV